ncbi:archaellum component FlaC [Clostridium algifaecis]|uniref:Archaellum component FlaC n=1 Tax=Clostridium algifaecis TaxID=1472040 RepID=A0ABS4KUH5_9CLOT|nr:methyl-accepting chemotaxis protein [Clostridium algifaecis]MBP2033685.1 archaellum component FlaC [Clostridium algifaecis]
MEQNIEVQNKLQKSFETLMPYMHYFFDEEIAFTMSTTSNFIKVVNSENIHMNAKSGDPLRPKGAAYECIKAGKPIVTIVPKETFGIEIKAIGIPVKDTNKIIGSIVLVKSLKRHYEFLEASHILAKSIDNISEASKIITSGIEKSVNLTEQIVSEVNDTTEKAKNTDKILDFIKNLSSKTNLLGLNAAIEASRAGKDGRGFSVVANEIRKLSSSSNKSTSQINSTLKQIEKSISNISTDINSTSDTFKEQLSQIQQLNSSINSLTILIDKLNKLSE